MNSAGVRPAWSILGAKLAGVAEAWSLKFVERVAATSIASSKRELLLCLPETQQLRSSRESVDSQCDERALWGSSGAL
jgi:hypothetical protein